MLLRIEFPPGQDGASSFEKHQISRVPCVREYLCIGEAMYEVYLVTHALNANPACDVVADVRVVRA